MLPVTPPPDSRIPHRDIFSPQARRGNAASAEASGGGLGSVSDTPLPHLSDVRLLALPCPSPSNLSPNTSNFTPERLLSCGDCVMGPFSGAQEIPHSAEVMGGGDTQL